MKSDGNTFGEVKKTNIKSLQVSGFGVRIKASCSYDFEQYLERREISRRADHMDKYYGTCEKITGQIMARSEDLCIV